MQCIPENSSFDVALGKGKNSLKRLRSAEKNKTSKQSNNSKSSHSSTSSSE
jgi:hypothetical protein